MGVQVEVEPALGVEETQVGIQLTLRLESERFKSAVTIRCEAQGIQDLSGEAAFELLAEKLAQVALGAAQSEMSGILNRAGVPTPPWPLDMLDYAENMHYSDFLKASQAGSDSQDSATESTD